MVSTLIPGEISLNEQTARWGTVDSSSRRRWRRTRAEQSSTGRAVPRAIALSDWVRTAPIRAWAREGSSARYSPSVV